MNHGRHDEHAGHDGHDKHAGHSVAMFRDKFWISLALTIPTLIWGHMLPRLLGYTPPTVPGHRWIAPVFGTAVFLYGGLVFLQGAWRELRARLPGRMTLIGLAISVAFVFSAAVTLGYPGMPLWEELATLVTRQQELGDTLRDLFNGLPGAKAWRRRLAGAGRSP